MQNRKATESMNPNQDKAWRRWRFMLIVAETILFPFLVAGICGYHLLPRNLILGAILVGLYVGSFIFLLFISPFLVKSQGPLAIGGWAIAFIMVLLSYARF